MHLIKTICTWSLTSIAIAIGAGASTVSAIEPAIVETAPLPNASVTIIADDGPVEISVAELEAIGLKRVKTESPWEKGQLIFEGVLFRDFLKEVGLDDAEAVMVRAADNYTQSIPRDDWMEGPLLLATRQDGQPLTLRTQGPTRLVYPLADRPEYDTDIHKRRWVWAITSIERTQ